MKKKISLISSFNIDNFHNYLKNNSDLKNFSIIKPKYGLFYEKIYQLIKSPNTYHLTIIWAQAEKIFKNFEKLINNEQINKKELDKELDNYINLLRQVSKKTKYLIILSMKLPRINKGLYLNDFISEYGITKNINNINLKISESLKINKNVFYINTDYLLANTFDDFDIKSWYFAKIPYSQNVFHSASLEISNILNLLDGKSIKLIITDLDNTLWGGVLGDLGWNNIILGGLNPAGEAYQDFQKKLKSFKNSGVQLAISSKNDEKIVLECFKKNKNMILKVDDFVNLKINWGDKAKNIQSIIKSLNILNENVLFLDDNINERRRVKLAFPGIQVPEMTDDPFSNLKIFSKYGLINNIQNTTKEDANRTKYYQDNLSRSKFKETFLSEDKWLKSLNTNVKFEKINEKNILRIVQLINRTNQMNLRTKRLSQAEIENLNNNQKNSFLYCCTVADKFGDMGIVGFFYLLVKNRKAVLKDLILSCRAFGREIENSMIFKVKEILIFKKVNSFKIEFIKTKKNKPCYEFLNNNFKKTKKNIFYCSDLKQIKKPLYLRIK